MAPNSDPWPLLALQNGIEIIVRANRQEKQRARLEFVDKNASKIAFFLINAQGIRTVP